MHIIKINGRDLRFTGSEHDGFFQNLPNFHAGNRELDRSLTGLRSDAVVLDVGANIGLTALTLATAVPDGHVFAFEPSPINVQYLRQNVEDNGLGNVTIVEAAVGAKGGTVTFNLPVSGAHSTVDRADAPPLPNQARVPLLALDAWATNRGLTRLDFIKIDVEGYEGDVLAGAAGLLVATRPLVLMEFNSVTLVFEAGLSPWVFAQELWKLFEISLLRNDGPPVPIATHNDLRNFVFSNMCDRGFVDDILLRVRPDTGAADIRRLA